MAARRTVAAILFVAATWASPSEIFAQASAYEELQNFSALLNLIRLNYVEDVDYTRLTRAAMQGVLQGLDPHNHILTRTEVAQLADLESGGLAGVGVHIEQRGESVVVLSAARYGPADRADVRPGDRILAVDESPIVGLGAREVEVRLLGKPGSRVRLRLARGARAEERVIDVRLKREAVTERSVSEIGEFEPGVGYVRIDRFGKGAADELKEAVEDLADRGTDLLLLLDLRGNPGGLLDEASAAASLFLWEDRLLFTTRGRKAEMNQEYRVPRSGRFRNVGLVVLIDEGSASASEALAVALQDNDRALIVGRRSFGKALVQTGFLLPRGDVVWLTVGRVYAPSGRLIQRDYGDLTTDDYEARAGEAPEADTLVFRTVAGRVVRGGGGVRPDVELPAPVPLPSWWTASVELGLPLEVATETASTISGTPESWAEAQDSWESDLLDPYLDLARSRLPEATEITSEERQSVARELAGLAAGVRWGREGQERFRLLTDPDIRRALQEYRRYVGDAGDVGLP